MSAQMLAAASKEIEVSGKEIIGRIAGQLNPSMHSYMLLFAHCR